MYVYQVWGDDVTPSPFRHIVILSVSFGMAAVNFQSDPAMTGHGECKLIFQPYITDTEKAQ